MLGSKAAIVIVALCGAAALLVPYAGLIVDVPDPVASPSTTIVWVPAPPVPTTAPVAAQPLPSPSQPPPTPGIGPVPEGATIEEVYALVVPEVWRASIAVEFEVIPGVTSYAVAKRTIQIAAPVARRGGPALAVVIAHEFGHILAYHHGSDTVAGSAPPGWPAATRNPVEHWADCVSVAFTGIDDPSHGLPSCGGPQLEWARQWLAAGPPG